MTDFSSHAVPAAPAHDVRTDAVLDHANFIVLLARQRSGTNALRSILGTHPEIFCFNEIFAPPKTIAYNEWLLETNYFHFASKQAGEDPAQLYPEHHQALFTAFLQHLRSLHSKRFLVLDVKYNTTHHVTQHYTPVVGPPYLFQLMMTLGVRTLVLTRRNYLRFLLSNKKAQRSGVYTVASDGSPQDQPVAIKPDELLFELERCAAEDERIDFWFTKYPKYWRTRYVGKYMRWDYADLFPGDCPGVSEKFLQPFAEWLGIANDFQQDPSYRKQSHLPLRESIENYAVIAQTLRGTRFEYCLEDEPLYRA